MVKSRVLVAGTNRSLLMSVYKNAAKLVGALVLVASSMAAVPGSAQAETGWLWYDSVFAAPTAAPTAIPARRARPFQVAAIAPAARPVQVSAVAPSSSSDCFWCNRRVYISGLSF
jgi:hypothetical protein